MEALPVLKEIMGPLGAQEMIAIFVLALLLFGPKKLPELGRLLGKGLSEFRRAKNELKATFESHLSELEKETRIDTTTASTDYSPAHYPYPYDEYGRYDSESQSPSVSQEHESSATGSSDPSTASATATQDAEAHRNHSSSQDSPVSGTVPRINGIGPAKPVPVAVEEQHPA